MKTLTINITLMPAPADIEAIASAMQMLARTLVTVPSVPTVLALHDDGGALIGAASFAFGEERDAP